MAYVRRYALALVALAIASIAGCGGSAQSVNPNQGAVEGYIFGRSRSQALSRAASRSAEPPSGAVAINDAVVTLSPGGRRATTGVDRDGNGGYFKITGLEPGSYTATVTHDGYHDSTFTVNVLAGTTTVAGANNGQTVLEPTGTMSRKKWTVMVYMDADCDLEEYGVLNMNQMESVGSDANINYVVQFDRGPGYDATNGDWTDTRRYLVTKDNDLQRITSPLLQNMGEVDMGQPSSLTEFITWAKTTYPADHYCLILWNHGAGWRSRQMPAASRGIIFDDTSNSYLTMGEMEQGIAAANTHFDLIAMDCSLMGMLEVAYQIKDQTDYIAFSEESPPGSGYPYDRICSGLSANPTMSAETFGRLFVTQHIAAYPQDAVTQSLVMTSRIAAYAQKVNAFATALIPTLTTNRTEFELARTRTQTYAYNYYRDLYDFARNAKANIPVSAVSTTADAVMQGLSGADGGPVIAEAHNLASMQYSHGLSIYLPSESQFYSGYSDLDLSKDYPKWNSLVKAIAGVQ